MAVEVKRYGEEGDFLLEVGGDEEAVVAANGKAWRGVEAFVGEEAAWPFWSCLPAEADLMGGLDEGEDESAFKIAL